MTKKRSNLKKSTIGKLSITGIDILMLNSVHILCKIWTGWCGMKLTVVKIKRNVCTDLLVGKKVQVKA